MRIFRRKTTWMTLENYNKAESFETFKVKPNKKEITIYTLLALNVAAPFTVWQITNPIIIKVARKIGWLR